MKNVLKPLPKNVLTTLGLSAAVTAANSGIATNILGSELKTVIILNEKMHDIVEVIKSLEESGSLIKYEETSKMK